MTKRDVQFSDHAALRMAQRNINSEDVACVLRYGREEHRTGVAFYFLGRRDVPEGLERELGHLVGVTLLVRGGTVITAYKNRRAIRAIRRKGKRDMKRGAASAWDAAAGGPLAVEP